MANKDSGPPYFVALYSFFTPIVLGLAVTNLDAMEFIHEYQTLITGLTAAIIAIAAVWAVINQTNEENKRAKDQEFKRHRAVRGIMPLALTQILEFSTETAIELDKIYNAVAVNQSLKQSNNHYQQTPIVCNFPVLDDFVLSNLEKMIEFSEGDIGEYIAKFVAIYQISTARFKSLAREVQPNSFAALPLHNITNRMHDTAEMYSIAASLFPYARFMTNTAPSDGPTQTDMRSALKDFEFNPQMNNVNFDSRYISINRPFRTIWDDIRPQP